MTYTLLRDPLARESILSVLRESDGACIPADPDNADWQAFRAWEAEGNAAADPPPAPVVAPDNPTLSDWRVGLTLWGRMDDVTGRVAALVSSTDPAKVMLGKVARERLEYANNVLRAQLLQLKDALGFSEADIDESLWRAAKVAMGDLSGKWPLKDG